MNFEMEDNLLKQALSKGDKKAFSKFFMKYFPRVKGFICQFQIPEAEAEDIAQDLFMNFWKNRIKFANVSNMDSYTFVSARNATLKYLKFIYKYKSDKSIDENLIGDSNSTETELKLNELYEILNREIVSMPPQRRKVFVKSRIDGKSEAEIANELGISIRTVQKHITDALAELKKVLLLVIITFFNT